jgi:hypothetical protein
MVVEIDSFPAPIPSGFATGMETRKQVHLMV